MATFSQRIGLKPMQTPLLAQHEVSQSLRTALWNVLCQAVWDFWAPLPSPYGMETRSPDAARVEELVYKIWTDLMGQAGDELPPFKSAAQRSGYQILRTIVMQGEWRAVYDLIDFVVQEFPSKPDNLIDAFNKALKREGSAFRFVLGTLSPISENIEISAIDEAAKEAKLRGLHGAAEHIASAIEMLGRRPAADYRNAVKEAICAVESVAKQLTGEEGATLGPALANLAGKTAIHSALLTGFKSIYGYTADADGIRHAILDTPTVDFAEAKYMVVSCSAFVHYLIQKADEAGLLKQQR